jgi:hypothetical protein
MGWAAEGTLRVRVRSYGALSDEIDASPFSRRDLNDEVERSLVLGLAFLALCLLANEAFAATAASPRIERIAKAGLIVAGWVALWRPMEIVLYDWWPIARQRRLYERLGRMPVEFRRAG